MSHLDCFVSPLLRVGYAQLLATPEPDLAKFGNIFTPRHPTNKTAMRNSMQDETGSA